MAKLEQTATQAALAAGADPKALAWARKKLGSQEYINLCQRFVENALGTQGNYPSAIDAWNSQQGQAQTDLRQMKPGDLIYFSANEGNQGYGHSGIYAGDGIFINPGPRGVAETPIADWLAQTGQEILGFIPQGGDSRRAPGLASPWPDEEADTFDDPFGLGLSQDEEDVGGLPDEEGSPASAGNLPPWLSSLRNSPFGSLFDWDKLAARLQKGPEQPDLFAGQEIYTDPGTGKRYLVRRANNIFGQPDPKGRITGFTAVPAGSQGTGSDVPEKNYQLSLSRFMYQMQKDRASQLRQEGKDEEAARAAALAQLWKERTFAADERQRMASAGMDYAKFGLQRQGIERANRALFSTRGKPAAPETQMSPFASWWESMNADPYSSPSFQQHLGDIGSSLQSPDFARQWNEWRNQVQGSLQPSVAPMEEMPWYKGIRGQEGLAGWRPSGTYWPSDLSAFSKLTPQELGDYSQGLETGGMSLDTILQQMKRRLPSGTAPRTAWGF